MRVTAIIYDLDGTLLNTLDDIADSMNAVLGAQGFKQHDYTAFKQFVGSGLRNLVRKATPPGKQEDEALHETLVAAMKAHYAGNLYNKTAPYPKIEATLKTIADRGIIQAVLSNKPHHYTQQMVARVLADHDFAAVYGARDDVPLKPDPTSALEIASIMKIEPKNCAYVGDSGSDMVTAINAGMLPVAVSWGFRSEDELRSAGAKYVLQSADGLLDLI